MTLSTNGAAAACSWSELNMMEDDTLDGWVEKYKHYSGYPVVGKVRSESIASRLLVLSLSSLM